MGAAITERREKERRAHLLNECPQGPVIEAQGEILADLKDSNKRVAIALETIAKQGAQVDSHEKHLDTHDAQLDTAFNQIRGIDARVMILEIKKGEWEGAKKAKEEIEIKTDKENQKIWTLLERLQLLTPVLLCLGFVLYLVEKFNLATKTIKVIKEFWPF